VLVSLDLTRKRILRPTTGECEVINFDPTKNKYSHVRFIQTRISKEFRLFHYKFNELCYLLFASSGKLSALDI